MDRHMKIKRITVVLLIAIFVVGGCGNNYVPPSYSGTDPKPTDKTVFIEMQPWYGNPLEGPSTGWYHWDYNYHYPADTTYLASHGKRDVAAVYYPIIGAYDSLDINVINWQIDICKAMRIDCIMIDYYGDGISPPSAEFRQYKNVTDRIITQANCKGIKVVLLYETQIQKNSTNMVNDILNDLNSIINNPLWMNNNAYLHYNNIPVICIFGICRLSDKDWDAIKNSIGNKACLVADVQPYRYEYPYQDNTAFNGCFEWDLYNDSIKNTVNPSYNMVKSWAEGLDNDCGWWARQKEDRFGFSIIWPGFDDSAVNGWGSGPRVTNFFTSDQPANHTAFYDATMQAALHAAFSNPWVLIATLNDWNESTSIEPSKEWGYTLAIQTKQFAETFKGIPGGQKQPDSIIQTITESYGFSYQ
jgi:hypothetical protein